MYGRAVVVLTLLMCSAEFAMTYKILSSRLYKSGAVGKGEGISTVNNHLLASHSSNKPLDDDDHRRTTLKTKANRNYFVPDFIPLPEEETFNPNNFYSIAPPGHPLFYSNAQVNNLPIQHFPMSNENHAAEPFRSDYLYTHYNPSHEFPPPDYGIEDIRYVPLVPEMSFLKPVPDNNTPQLPINTPIPYVQMVTSNIPPAPSAIEEDMVKKIMQIVSDFEKFNKTQVEPEFREDSTSPMKNTSATLITSTTVEENNTTGMESTINLGTNESKTEIHSNRNQTESSQIIQVDAMPPSTTEMPSRYVIDNFIDQNGNPCAKEVVLTAEKKTYYVYTCEEKGIPRTSTVSSSVTQYRDELHTTNSDTTDEAKDISTTPMTAEDQTLPETLNDYVIYNLR